MVQPISDIIDHTRQAIEREFESQKKDLQSEKEALEKVLQQETREFNDMEAISYRQLRDRQSQFQNYLDHKKKQSSTIQQTFVRTLEQRQAEHNDKIRLRQVELDEKQLLPPPRLLQEKSSHDSITSYQDSKTPHSSGIDSSKASASSTFGERKSNDYNSSLYQSSQGPYSQRASLGASGSRRKKESTPQKQDDGCQIS